MTANPIGDALFGAFQAKQEPPRYARVTQIPLDGNLRQQGYVITDIDGNRVQVQVGPSDTFLPGDTILVQRTGSKAGAGYTSLGFVSGTRPDSGIVEVPVDTTIGGVAYKAGDQYLGALSGANWWFKYNNGVWVMRQAATMMGAIGNLNGLYGYASAIWGSVFGEYGANKTWIATDPTNGFRIMLHNLRTFQANPVGVTSFGIENETEIEIDPVAQTIAFKINGQVVSYVGATGVLHVDMHRQLQYLAEFPGAVLDAQGGANIGTLTGKHDATHHRNYYDWTTSEGSTQNYDIVLQIKLPPEFSYLDPLGLDNPRVFLQSSVSSTPGATGVRLVEFLDDDGVNCITPATAQNTSWDVDSYEITGGTFAPCDTLTVRIRMLADPGKHAMLHSVWLNWVAGE